MILENKVREIWILLILLLIGSGLVGCVQTQKDNNKPSIGLSQKYPQEYNDWQNGFLAGNGKMGIIVFGNPLDETVIFDDRRFFMAASTSTPERFINKVSEEDLKAIRDYCVAENWKAANDLANEVHGWKNGGEGNKHPGFKMKLNIPEQGTVKNYSRICDFSTGEIIVKWTDDRGDWERRSFVSRKDNVVVQYIKAPTGAKLNCSVLLTTDPGMHFPGDMKFTNVSDVDFLNLRANYSPNTDDAGYEGVTKVIVDGGAKSVDDGALNVKDANSLMLITRTEKYYSDCEAQWNKKELQTQLDSIPVDYKTLIEGQIETHKAIFDRVKLDLNASEADRALSNEELIAKQKASSTAVTALWERVFDSGRYLYLSSSSDVAPPDLLGIWTGDSHVGWSGYYHLDANLNLQISSGNIGAMPEAMEGYFTLMERLAEGFKTNASDLLGCRGMVGGGNTAGLTGIISKLSYSYPYQYVSGEMGWLLYPFWEHYLITGDKEFLKNRLFPLLKEMGYFYEDFLVAKDKNGKYIFAGSISPEAGPAGLGFSLVNNSTFDIAGAKFCLSTLIESCEILGMEKELSSEISKWQGILDKLPPYLVNDEGALQEWSWPGFRDGYGHRHSSHMITVWPLNEITPKSPEWLYKAARTALDKKDEYYYGDCGHGIIHGALNAANLNNAASVNNKILRLLRNDFYFEGLATAHYSNFKVFCTDVCNTMPGIMMEMLVNSTAEVIELLPAVPETLKKGAVSGLKARNQVTVEKLSWDFDKNTVECTLKSNIDQTITLIQRRGIKAIKTKAKVGASKEGDIAREIELKAGKSVKISMEVNEPAKNVALNRAAYHSSSVNYDNTGHLVTDGSLESNGATAIINTKYKYYKSGYGPEKLFDGSTDSKYMLYYKKDDWIQYDFPGESAYAIDRYVVTSSYDLPDRDPKNWTFEASNNGTDWAVLDSQFDVTFTERRQAKPFKINNTAQYKMYRLNISVNTGGPQLQLSEIGLFEGDVNRIGRQRFSSEWVSYASEPQWIYIDLGADCSISSAKLFWDKDFASDYKIEVSKDKSSWQTIYSTTAGNGDVDEINFTPVSVRYVKLALNKSVGDTYSLIEFEVYGTGGPVIKPEPVPEQMADGKQFLSGGNWRLTRANEIKLGGKELSMLGYNDTDWLVATVPGTALTTYLNNGAIPDPNFGDQQLQISDAYFTTSYWYRNTFKVPGNYEGKKIWLNFNGINWKADVYVNGKSIGKIEGAFIKGVFDITSLVKSGEEACVAVFIHKNDNPGSITVQTLESAGKNGGVLGYDNPTLHSSVGWDWIPTIRGRNVGIQDDVFLSASGDVTIQYPFIKTTLPLPDTTSATLDIEVELKNNSDQKVAGVLKGSMDSGDVTFSKKVEVDGNTTSVVKFTKDEFTQLVLKNPKLWWPNGYGQQNMHKMTFTFEVNGKESDVLITPFGIRQVTTTTDDMLTIYVNGLRITMKGGNWGLSESMMRLDAQGYDDRVRMHKEENFTMIRNWVGMTGDEAFYDACDKYGVMIWDDFWLANPGDGPNPNDPDMFMENATYKVKHFRNHPAIALYCGRNEGNPPATLFDKLIKLTDKYDGTRQYIPHSADQLVSGWGPYSTQHPRWYMKHRRGRKLHSEMGMPNVPTYESIKAMMPEENLWPINEMWGIHDYCNSAQGCNRFTDAVNNNYGEATGIEDFCRKAQMVNMENHKAMFEAVANARSNGLLMWMSQSAWPSMVWQTYDYFLEQNAGFFGCKKACEPLHILWDNYTNDINVTNNTNKSFSNLTAEAKVYNLDGTEKFSKSVTIDSNIDDVTECLKLEIPSDISATYFVKLKLMDGDKVLSDNFYWFGKKYQNHTALSGMNDVTLKGAASVKTKGDSQFMTVEFSNPSKDVALTVRAKLLTSPSGERVLPAFCSDNYFSLLPGESKIITIEYRTASLLGGKPKLMVEGWNIVPAEIQIK